MTTAVQYWRVGSSAEERLELTAADVAGHLIADWVPSLPTVSAIDLMGWPNHLLRAVGSSYNPYLAIDEQVSGCERQWKGVVSWMLGVACARKVLSEEGYQWVAPVSAFYPSLVTPVNVRAWHPAYPPSRLKITGNPSISSNLRPDYIALRTSGLSGRFDWALAESKGTSAPLGNKTCPRTWRDQVHNALVNVTQSGVRATNVPIARHIVIATRVNPNARREKTRRLQVRGWNSEVPVAPAETGAAEIEVMAAHLYCLCYNLGLFRNASAIAEATRLRERSTIRDSERQHLATANVAADEELQTRNVKLGGFPAKFTFPMNRDESESLRLQVTVESPAMRLIQTVRQFTATEDNLRDGIISFGSELSAWYSERRTSRSERVSVQREGVVVEIRY